MAEQLASGETAQRGEGDDKTPVVPPQSEGEKTFLFVGEKGSGKSSLIAKFLGDPVKEDMPETIALDFKFGKKNQEEKNQKVSIYEVGGGRTLAEMIGVPMNHRQICNTAVVIALDLSKPGNCVDSLLFWLNAVREHI